MGLVLKDKKAWLGLILEEKGAWLGLVLEEGNMVGLGFGS